MKLLLAAVAASFLAPRADTLAFSVKPGEKIGKQIEISVDFASQRISISLAGKELPEEILKKFEVSMSNTIELAVEDEYGALEGGRPTAFARRFQSAKNHAKAHEVLPGAKPKDKDETLESPLAGHAVEFRWDPKKEGWTRAFAGAEGDPASLELLKPDMDFLALLRAGELEQGARWKIDAAHFSDLVKPGGELSFPSKKDSGAQFEFGKNPSGTIEATFTGTREDKGRRLAVIELEMHLKTAQEADPAATLPLAFDGTLELKGEYLWDLERGRLASYSIGGPATLTATGEKEVPTKDQQKVPMRMRFDFTGELKAKGRFE
jgi:hypothetical protein